jgi:hypothetical protein
MLRRIFGTKMEEVAGGWRRLHNEVLHNLFDSTYIIKVIKSMTMRCAEPVARMGKMRNAHKILVAKYKGKRPLGRPKRR